MKVVESAERIAAIVARWVRPGGDVVGSLYFPRKLQANGWSCGSSSVLAIARYFDRDVTHDEVMDGCGTTTDGTATMPIVTFLRRLGLRAGYHRRMSFRQLTRALARGGVVLVDIAGTHWATVHAVSGDGHVWIADPSLGKLLGRRLSKARFRSRWTGLGVIVSESSRGRRRT